jgi:MerR family transcriptional regulator, mercuric resistance operon regulatory protein
MRTSEVAAAAGVNAETLRYYERRGLLAEPVRGDSGYRAYGPHAVRVVRFVKEAQRLGFTLDEVTSLLELGAGGPESCDAVREMAGARLAELELKIRTLESMRHSLQRLVATCSRPRAQRDCPLLQSIEAQSGGSTQP